MTNEFYKHKSEVRIRDLEFLLYGLFVSIYIAYWSFRPAIPFLCLFTLVGIFFGFHKMADIAKKKLKWLQVILTGLVLMIVMVYYNYIVLLPCLSLFAAIYVSREFRNINK